MEFIDVKKLAERISENEQKYNALYNLILKAQDSGVPHDDFDDVARRLFKLKPGINFNVQTVMKFKEKFQENVDRLNNLHAKCTVDRYETQLLCHKYIEFLDRYIEGEIYRNATPEDKDFVAKARVRMAENIYDINKISKPVLSEISDIRELGAEIGINVPEFNEMIEAAKIRVEKLEYKEDLEYIQEISTHAVGLKLRADVRAIEYNLDYAELIYAGSHFIGRSSKKSGVFNWAQVGGYPPQISTKNIEHKLEESRGYIEVAIFTAAGMGYLLDKRENDSDSPKPKMN